MKQKKDFEIYEEVEEKNNLVYYLNNASTWFMRLGIIIAVVLIIYYLVNLKILNAIIYIFGLIIAFIFGYLFMYLLDKLSSNN